MVQNIYTIFDKISKTWTVPFFEINNEKVFRDFEYLINENKDGKNEIGIFYKDKELWLLGNYSMENGTINLLSEKTKIIDLAKLKKEEAK